MHSGGGTGCTMAILHYRNDYVNSQAVDPDAFVSCNPNDWLADQFASSFAVAIIGAKFERMYVVLRCVLCVIPHFLFAFAQCHLFAVVSFSQLMPSSPFVCLAGFVVDSFWR